MIIKTFFHALKSAMAAWRGLLLVHIINFALALPSAYFFYTFVNNLISRSMMAEKVLVDFYFPFYGQVVADHPVVIISFFSGCLAGGFVYLLLSIFFSGGFITYFAGDAVFSAQQFLSDSLRYFWRFCKVILLSIPLYVVLVILFAMLMALTGSITEDALTEVPRIKLTLFSVGLSLILLFLLTSLIDVIKIHIVYHEETEVLRPYLHGIAWWLKHIHKMAGMLFLLLITGGVVFTLYFLIEGGISPTGTFGILTLFLWQQIFIFSRQWLKAGFLGAYTGLFLADPYKKEQPYNEFAGTDQPEPEPVSG